MKKAFLSLASLLCLALATARAGDAPGSKDNPFLKRFEGSEIVVYKARNYDRLSFFETDYSKQVSQEGKMVRILYRVAPEKTSSLEVFRNYEDELKGNGFSLVHSGAMDQLGVGKEVVQNAAQQGGFIADMWNGSFQNEYDIYALKHDPSGDIHVRVCVFEMTQSRGGLNPGEVGVLVDSLQCKAVTKKMVDGNASEMANQIASTGSVNLYGIYFDSSKADIKPASKPTLDEVGKLLSNDPSLKLKVVGHTDNVGTAEYNVNLSMRRAQSVAQSLTQDYSIAADRLVSFGAGATQPVASNDTEQGRAKNRRVELVKI